MKTFPLIIFFMLGCFSKLEVKQVSKFTCKYKYESNFRKKIYTQVDEMPRFPESAGNVGLFMMKNMREVDSVDTQGSVRLSFVIDVDGGIFDLKIRDKTVYNYTPLEKEILRVLKTMPKWIPARCNKKKVSFQWYELVHISKH